MARISSLANQAKYVMMIDNYTVKDKLTLFLIATGIFCFGVIFPDSLSTHVRMVHFAAHFGMSFLIAFCFYMICTVKMRIPKAFSYTVLILATLTIGVVYKYWEISTQGMIGKYSFQTIVDHTGVMTSMSQNISGVLGAMLLIEGLVDRNLAMTVLKSGKLEVSKRGNLHVVGNTKNNKPVANLKVVSHFSSVSDN